MAYTIDDITELILHHLVLSTEDETEADDNLSRLIENIEGMISRPQQESGLIIACDTCGTWVYSELIGPDGAGYSDDGSFWCSDCRWHDGDGEHR
jgi:hypothetical protein